MNCTNCKNETDNPKFCSSSCSAIYSNARRPRKRGYKNSCAMCPTKVPYNNKYCKKCRALCKKHGTKKVMHGKQSRCNICVNEQQNKYRSGKIKRLKEMAGGECQICHYSRSFWALSFHHIDESTKEFALSSKNKSMDKMIEEASKCLLVCANCHAEIHEGVTIVTGIEPAISSLTD